MERTFYKLLIVGLAILSAIQAWVMVVNISEYLKHASFIDSAGILSSIIYVGSSVSKFVLSVCALYWLPKMIKKFFPEVV